MKILHIAPDEKFLDSAIWQFESVYPGGNQFIVLLPEGRKNPQWVKNKETVVLRNRTKQTISDVCESQKEYELLCFHSMDYFMGELVHALPLDTRILWMVFGYEVYDNEKLSGATEFLGNKTKRYFLENQRYAFLKRNLRPLKYAIKKEKDPNLVWMQALQRADYCGVLFKEEYQSIKQRIDGSADFFRFSYYPIEFMLEDMGFLEGEDILLGNSATLTNNHLDVFEKLKGFPLEKRKLIVPLSYGDMSYAKKVVTVGSRSFPENFEPLVDFLSLKEYNRYISRCSVVIMGHRRQQAVGNVLVMLYRGAKVYLDKNNTLYAYLKRIGLAVYSVQEDLDQGNDQVFSALPTLAKQTNRAILEAEIGQDVLLADLKKQLVQLKNAM